MCPDICMIFDNYIRCRYRESIAPLPLLPPPLSPQLRQARYLRCNIFPDSSQNSWTKFPPIFSTKYLSSLFGWCVKENDNDNDEKEYIMRAPYAGLISSPKE